MAGVADQVGVGQIDREQQVVFLHGRAEEQGPASFQAEQQAGKETSAFMIDAFLTETDGLDVAKMVEDGKGIAVLEDQAFFVRRGRRGEDVVRALGPGQAGFDLTIPGPWSRAPRQPQYRS